jgi:hypothetical protein
MWSLSANRIENPATISPHPSERHSLPLHFFVSSCLKGTLVPLAARGEIDIGGDIDIA